MVSNFLQGLLSVLTFGLVRGAKLKKKKKKYTKQGVLRKDVEYTYEGDTTITRDDSDSDYQDD